MNAEEARRIAKENRFKIDEADFQKAKKEINISVSKGNFECYFRFQFDTEKSILTLRDKGFRVEKSPDQYFPLRYKISW